MPEKSMQYNQVIFTPEVIKAALNILGNNVKHDKTTVSKTRRIVLLSKEEWSHDTDEEFFADYRKGFIDCTFSNSFLDGGYLSIYVFQDIFGRPKSKITIRKSNRAEVEEVFAIFDANEINCQIQLTLPPEEKPQPPKIKVFIGHGHNMQWKDLKDHLHDKHDIQVEAYEIGIRAGLTIKEVLEEMLTSSSIALLVFTGEDIDAEGDLHARENVIHELGLFQGRLGWRKAIVLLEDGVTEFSNIYGLSQIRFSKNNIKETFGEVVATIKREFRVEK